MRRVILGVAAVVALAGCGGNDRAEVFRETFKERYESDDPFEDPAPDLSDEAIEEIFDRVCVDGEPQLGEGDEAVWRASEYGEAVMAAVREAGCP